MTPKERYWQRRNAGLCVSCGKVKTDKSRCPECMKNLSIASNKTVQLKIERLQARIKELEAQLNEN